MYCYINNIVILSFTTNVFINSVISFHYISKIRIDSIIYFLSLTTVIVLCMNSYTPKHVQL